VTVLVLRALGLGDFLTAVPALRAVRRAFPRHDVILAAPPAIAPLADLSGAVDAVLPAGPLEPVALRDPDIAINLHGRGPQSHRVLLATRPRRLIGFANADVAQSTRMPEWRADEHEVDRWCRLLRECAIDADPTDLRLPRPAVPPPLAAVDSVLIHPGAAAPSRRWPVERWAEVARMVLQRGARVSVSAGPGEGVLAARIVELAGLDPRVVVSGGLMEFAAAVVAARALLSADTGVAHLATALGTPSIVLFGPTSPAHWGPPRSHPHIALWAGRLGDPHGQAADPGLLELEPKQVVEALDSLQGVHRRASVR
jgi:ADP-heptose:LPS heptosyltransferase